MNRSLVLIAICVAFLGGCVTAPPPPSNRFPDPSDPAAPHVSTRPLRTNLVATTKVYLDPSLGREAQKMEHGNMQGMPGMEGMQGMDHSKMKGMEKMDHSKMPGMAAQQRPAGTPAQQGDGMKGMDPSKMQGMDHSKMSGTETKHQPSPAPAQQPGGMQGMDHSKMPGMTSQPQDKETLEKEMKKTSDEMKKLSDELKQKADEAPAERPSPSPQRDHGQMQHQGMSPAPPNQRQNNVIYTCVMHPEVKSEKPGKCPKCGMKLVPKSAAQ
jgi:rubrerythrin